MSSSKPALTLSEAGIARLVAEGRTDDEVASLLGVEPGAVLAGLSGVFRKLGLESRTELALLLAGSPGEVRPANDGPASGPS